MDLADGYCSAACAAWSFGGDVGAQEAATSETLVAKDQPTVPTEFVKPVVTDDLNHRLASMQEQILSRTRLQPIIEKFGLYAEERQRKCIDVLVEKLRNAVTVKPMESMPGTQNHSLPGFYVNVTFNNPRPPSRFAGKSLMFMQQNTRERKQQAVQTTSFLSEQLEEAKEEIGRSRPEAGCF